MEKVNFTINGIAMEGIKGETIMAAAERAGFKIPKICHTEMQNVGITIKPVTCRVCEVEVNDGKIVASCVAPIREGLEVKTNSKLAQESRKKRLEDILADHPQDCLACVRNMSCQLQTLASEMGIREINPTGTRPIYEIDESSHSLVRDQNKCIYCRRCDAVCSEVQAVHALKAEGKGVDAMVVTSNGAPLGNTLCVFCGQCAAVCPTGAISIKDDTKRIWEALHDPDTYVVVQIAPSVRAGLGEAFGMPAGENVAGKLNTALRLLGFDKVLNTNFAADMTIMEEASEFIHRFKNKGTLPMITSCCPSWVKFAEDEYGDLLDHMSSCKSPQGMFGAVAKTYYADKIGVDPKKIFSMSIMPCTAKKFEIKREQLAGEVDASITTQEIAKMIKESAIDFLNLQDSGFDSIMGEESGAGQIFGVTGGVMQAALRTAYETVTLKKLDDLIFEPLVGFKGSGVKEARVNLNGTELRVAVAHELRNAVRLLDEIRKGESPYHFIEIMACPGGCVNGGGQPYHTFSSNTVSKRSAVLYDEDKNNPIRRSHENMELKKLYDEFLGKPYYGENAHNLLHTTYKANPKGDED
ncbi:MAG: NADH-dependent [FeFe] hydrogenase, group A6 [Defluviitaleaceae bacterium]|nr:NADH-dependent [FeFe] hydrogenase, group A6 [Defluviitaleaceae bacterium]